MDILCVLLISRFLPLFYIVCFRQHWNSLLLFSFCNEDVFDLNRLKKEVVKDKWTTLQPDPPQKRELGCPISRSLHSSVNVLFSRRTVRTLLFDLPLLLYLRLQNYLSYFWLNATVQHMMYGFGDDPNVGAIS